MSCCKHATAEAIDRLTAALVAESRRWLLKVFPPPSRPLGFGSTEHKGERKVNEMFVEQYTQTFLPLPPAEGNNADITKGVFVVMIGESVVHSQDVAYDLITREPQGPSEMFEIPKGTEYTMSLSYVDDETPPNVSSAVTATAIATDTSPPDAPAGFGGTSHVGEREVPDA